MFEEIEVTYTCYSTSTLGSLTCYPLSEEEENARYDAAYSFDDDAQREVLR